MSQAIRCLAGYHTTYVTGSKKIIYLRHPHSKSILKLMKTPTVPLTELLSLSGKTALITGAANGIGRAIATRYAELGAGLQLIDLDAVGLEKTAEKLRSDYQISVDAAAVDLGSTKAISKYWDKLDNLPDILVNNAGVFWPKKLEQIDDQSYEQMMSINTKSVIWMCREMITRRGKDTGTIINISSIEAVVGMTDNMLLYGASKAAVLAVSRALVKDYGAKGWKINTILPGGINTPGTKELGLAALKKFDLSIVETGVKYGLRKPGKNMGHPDDVARATVWLGTSASDYMNGSEVVIDGGFLAV